MTVRLKDKDGGGKELAFEIIPAPPKSAKAASQRKLEEAKAKPKANAEDTAEDGALENS